MIASSETLRACVDHILQSATFGNAPSSRRLLKYLADRSAEGSAEHLKEYAIGVDAFGKAPGYDPRQDSTVRIQIGRLRQKLADYYRDEGGEDTLLIDLPKGQFTLTCEPRPAIPVSVPMTARPEILVPYAPSGQKWRVVAIALGGFCLLLLSIGVYKWDRSRTGEIASAADPWSPELAELWAPFIHTGRPLLIAVGNPLFLQFENKAIYRDLSVENAEDLLKSPHAEAVKQALGSQQSRPVHYYAAVGDVSAAFLLGQRLGSRQTSMSIVRSSQLQWQQLADANVLFLGPPRFFGDKLNGLPASLEIIEGTAGFQVVHPHPGEQSLYSFRDPPGFFSEDGEACVLITRAAGPGGNTDVMTFASNNTFGRMGAVSAFTEASFARSLANRMRGPTGHIPQYFQVLLRVKYKGGVPTETVYLLHREIYRRN
jgi:hypothetical protein